MTAHDEQRRDQRRHGDLGPGDVRTDELRRAERPAERRSDEAPEERRFDQPGDDGTAGPTLDQRAPAPDAGPDKPTQLPRGALWTAIKATAKEFKKDNLPDWAAALTYYSVLSIFPALLVLVSLIGLVGPSSVRPLMDNIGTIAPGAVRNILDTATNSLEGSQRLSGVAGVLALLIALWSASQYVSAFMRASNAIYDVPEGRPIWKTVPIRVGVTALTVLMLVASLLIILVTGGLASAVGRTIGLESTAVTVWDIAKWPVLLILVGLTLAVLYWASPNARQGGFRWITPGGLLAVLLWIVVSALFALYVTNFSSYNKTYGTLAGIIIFLVWLWLSNLAILFGAEIDSELDRQRAIAAGHPEEVEPYLQLRDTRKVKPDSGTELS